MPSLPTPGDDDVWGAALNAFLEVVLNSSSGALKPNVVDSAAILAEAITSDKVAADFVSDLAASIAAAVAPMLPGYEIGYTSTGSGVISATAQGSATEIMSMDVTTDGDPVMLIVNPRNVYSPTVANSPLRLGLWIDGTYEKLLVAQNTATASFHMNEAIGSMEYRHTPDAGDHTYSVRGWFGSTTGGPVGFGGGFGDGDAIDVDMRLVKI